MRTNIVLDDRLVQEALALSGARTKREAIVTAITEFNHRRRMAELTKRAGSCPDLMTADELRQLRRRG